MVGGSPRGRIGQVKAPHVMIPSNCVRGARESASVFIVRETVRVQVRRTFEFRTLGKTAERRQTDIAVGVYSTIAVKMKVGNNCFLIFVTWVIVIS